MDRVQQIGDSLFALLKLTLQRGGHSVLFLLHHQDSVGDTVYIGIGQNRLYRQQHGDPLDPVLAQRLFMTSQPSLRPAAFVVTIFGPVG